MLLPHTGFYPFCGNCHRKLVECSGLLGTPIQAIHGGLVYGSGIYENPLPCKLYDLAQGGPERNTRVFGNIRYGIVMLKLLSGIKNG